MESSSGGSSSTSETVHSASVLSGGFSLGGNLGSRSWGRFGSSGGLGLNLGSRSSGGLGSWGWFSLSSGSGGRFSSSGGLSISLGSRSSGRFGSWGGFSLGSSSGLGDRSGNFFILTIISGSCIDLRSSGDCSILISGSGSSSGTESA